MGSSIALVVTCTHRKYAQPDPSLLLRNLPETGPGVRACDWLRRLETAGNHRKLADLYRGEAWSRARRLLTAAQSSGFKTRMFVASAGLGLRSLTSAAPAYGATFSPGHQDSVAQTPEGMRAWWAQLQQQPQALRLDEIDADRIVLVLSAAYDVALQDDLVRLGQSGASALVVGGNSNVAGVTRLPVSLKLRDALGGTAGSLNLRAAERWLRVLVDHDLDDEAALQDWRRWHASVDEPTRPLRTPQSDDEVVEFILDALRCETGLTKSRALRRFRDTGLACEQSRFGQLFTAAVAGAQS